MSYKEEWEQNSSCGVRKHTTKTWERRRVIREAGEKEIGLACINGGDVKGGTGTLYAFHIRLICRLSNKKMCHGSDDSAKGKEGRVDCKECQCGFFLARLIFPSVQRWKWT